MTASCSQLISGKLIIARHLRVASERLVLAPSYLICKRAPLMVIWSFRTGTLLWENFDLSEYGRELCVRISEITV